MTTESKRGLDEAIAEPVVLERSDPAWPRQFAEERKRLIDGLPPKIIAIEHFGSTAVPGLLAKPVIDMLAGFNALIEADSLIDDLIALGYHYPVDFNSTLSDRRWLMRQYRGRRTHHLHLVVHGGPAWSQELRFRDLLRTNAAVAEQYAMCKAELAATYRSDREAYTRAKADFIAQVLCARPRL